MTPRARSPQPKFFADASDFGAWLEQHGASTPELIVGFYKVGSGIASITWPESVDEALCHGWIDGVRKRIDDCSYLIRFTPRRPGSIWSAINIAKAAGLLAQGRMRPAGMRAYSQRTERRSSVYSYEQSAAPELSVAQLRALKRRRKAWTYWQDAPPSYRKTLTHCLTSAKQQATRARRLARLIEACEQGRRL